MTQNVRVVSWNLNARKACRAQQAATIAAFKPDLVALQEVTAGSWPELAKMLRPAGLVHGLSGPETLPAGRIPVLGRFVAVLSRWPLLTHPEVLEPAPEVALCATVAGPAAEFDLLALHVPTIAHATGLKVPVQEAVAARLCLPHERPWILCGDFNSPKAETPDGEIVAFITPRRQREHAAEMGLLTGLRGHGFVDAFRALNGYEADGRSWFWKRHGRTDGYRLDHVLATATMRPVACWYAHEARLSGWSDHSPVVADFELQG